MDVRFVAGFGPIAPDVGAARAFYADALRLPLTGDDEYLSTPDIDGVKHFAVWPLRGAAQSCFGTDEWPAEVPVPQGWIEFDVDDVAAATAELRERGYEVLVADRLEPWGQRVTRLLGPDGLLVGITYTPHLRGESHSAS
ncbi:MAG: VOC family protein [Sphaerobacter sp.]|nr:VOC family protein [Sphaerobacter sp.]